MRGGSGGLAQDPPERRGVRWTDLSKRAVSAAILAPLALASIWLGSGAWALVVGLLTVGLACEWVWICGLRLTEPPGLVVPVAASAACILAADERDAAAFFALAAGAVGAWLLTLVLPAGRMMPAFRSFSLAAGIPYIGAASIALLWLRQDEGAGRANVLFLILIVWASDVGAYAVGRLVGGPKLAPHISPNKTWSGAIGGLLAAAMTGAGFAFLADGGDCWLAAAVAVSLGCVSQFGDLLESLFKRRFGVKDSGRLIPGHGGLLDRLDGVLAAAPAAALLALALGPGVVLWQ